MGLDLSNERREDLALRAMNNLYKWKKISFAAYDVNVETCRIVRDLLNEGEYGLFLYLTDEWLAAARDAEEGLLFIGGEPTPSMDIMKMAMADKMDASDLTDLQKQRVKDWREIVEHALFLEG